jgi:hypothetical protein
MWFVYVPALSYAFWRLDKGASMEKLTRIYSLTMVRKEI